MNQPHIKTSGSTNKTRKFKDIEIRPVAIGLLPMSAKWYHRGELIFSDARTIYTEYMAPVQTARYGLYQFGVNNSAGSSMYNVLYTPNLEEGILYFLQVYEFHNDVTTKTIL